MLPVPSSIFFPSVKYFGVKSPVFHGLGTRHGANVSSLVRKSRSLLPLLCNGLDPNMNNAYRCLESTRDGGYFDMGFTGATLLHGFCVHSGRIQRSHRSLDSRVCHVRLYACSIATSLRVWSRKNILIDLLRLRDWKVQWAQTVHRLRGVQPSYHRYRRWLFPQCCLDLIGQRVAAHF